MFRFLSRPATALALACLGAVASAQSFVQVEGAWVRVSVPGQQGTGAFMRLTASEPLTLVGVVTPAAGVAEVHEMKMDGDVMRMRAVPALELPAGRAVEFKPGGYHLMLQELKAPLRKDMQVPLTLVFRDAKGAERRLDLQAPVSATAPAGSRGASATPGHDHQGTHKH